MKRRRETSFSFSLPEPSLIFSSHLIHFPVFSFPFFSFPFFSFPFFSFPFFSFPFLSSPFVHFPIFVFLEVLDFWEAIEKLVHFKHKAVLEAKMQKVPSFYFLFLSLLFAFFFLSLLNFCLLPTLLL